MHRSTSTRLAPFVFALLCLALGPKVSAAPGVFEGRDAWLDPRGVRVPDAELAFTDLQTAHFRNEAVYVTGRLDNGWVFTTGFFGWRLGLLRGYGAYALVGKPDGSRTWMLRQLRRDDLQIGAGRLSVSALGVLFEGSGSSYRATARGDGIGLELALEGMLQPWKPGDGVARLTDDPGIFTRLALPAPWAKVTGWVTLGGERTPVTGQAYTDLTVTVLPMQRLPTETTCFRVWSAPGTAERDQWFLSVIEYVPHAALGAVRQPVLLLAHGSDWVLTTPLLVMERLDFADAPSGSYPARLAVSARDQGYTLTGEFRTDVLYETTDMFGEIPPALRAIVSLFAQRSLNFRSIGAFHGTLTGPEGVTRALDLSGVGEYLVVR